MENFNSKQKNYYSLEQALKDSAVLRAFRSNGDLRIIHLEKDGEVLRHEEYSQFLDGIANIENKFGIINKGQLDDKAVEVRHFSCNSPILQKIISCFILCGESIEVHFSKREKHFVCSTPAPSNESVSYTGVGNDVLSAVYSCISSKMMYREFAKMVGENHSKIPGILLGIFL